LTNSLKKYYLHLIFNGAIEVDIRNSNFNPFMVFELLRVYDRKTIERGESYYSEGRVIYAVKSGKKLLGEVRGNERYYVEVDLNDFSAICSCPVRYNCKHAVALILSYLNGKFTENNTELAKAYPITAVSDVGSVIKKILKYPSENDVLDVVRLLRFRGKDVSKDFLIELLESLEDDEFYNDYHNYYFHELLIETVVDLLVEKGLNEEDKARLKRIAESGSLIGEDLAYYLAHYYDEFLGMFDLHVKFKILYRRDKKKAYEFAMKHGLKSELVAYFEDLSNIDFSNLSYDACVVLLKRNYKLKELFEYCLRSGYYDLCVEIALKLDDVEMMKKVCELDYKGKVEILKIAKKQELLPYAVKTVKELVEKGGRDNYKLAVSILKNLKMLNEKVWKELISELKLNHSRKYALWEEIRKVFGDV